MKKLVLNILVGVGLSLSVFSGFSLGADVINKPAKKVSDTNDDANRYYHHMLSAIKGCSTVAFVKQKSAALEDYTIVVQSEIMIPIKGGLNKGDILIDCNGAADLYSESKSRNVPIASLPSPLRIPKGTISLITGIDLKQLTKKNEYSVVIAPFYFRDNEKNRFVWNKIHKKHPELLPMIPEQE